ncbi:hypothetical protein ACHAQH_009386 [Verticillium albo-atrum]
MSKTSTPSSPPLMTPAEALASLGLHPGFGDELHTDVEIQQDIEAGKYTEVMDDLYEMVWDIIFKIGYAQMDHNKSLFEVILTHPPPSWLEGADHEDIRLEITRSTVLGNSPQHLLGGFSDDEDINPTAVGWPSEQELRFRMLSNMVTLSLWGKEMLTKWNMIFMHYFPGSKGHVDLGFTRPGNLHDRWYHFMRGTQLMINEFHPKDKGEAPHGRVTMLQDKLGFNNP